MKGVIFSADFVDDADGNLRLLEFNTDTGFSDYVLDNLLNFNDICNLINDNSIVEVYIIHKPQIHKKFVSALSNSIQLNCLNVTSIIEYKESSDSVYPQVVDDAPNRLIIRLAYDELALFDSEYCKNTLNLFKLFIENNETENIAQIYHSSQEHGILDTIGEFERNNNLPDAVLKKIQSPHFNTQFIKFNQDGNIEDHYNEYISNLTDDDILQKYYVSNVALSQNNTYSNRGYFFMYGDNLDLIPISIFSINSLLPLPLWENISLQPSITGNSYFLSKKHYYEFATNYWNQSISAFNGVYESESIILASEEIIPIKNSEVGMEIKSIFIGGDAPNTDNYLELYEWQMPGNTLPSDSEAVNSFIMNVKNIDVHNNMIHQIIFDDGNTLESSYNKPLLVYNSETNMTKYLQAGDVTGVHQVYKSDGSLLNVSAVKYLIPNDEDSRFISINTEESDLYILSGSNIIVHNVCFVAGTKIIMSDSSEKNIEEVYIGDTIMSHNLITGVNETDVVKEITSREVMNTVQYIFDDGFILESTVDHPIYIKDKGWSSYDNLLSNQMYNIGGVSKIRVGDFAKTFNSYVKIKNIIVRNKKTKVYNLSKIEHNHNFFANTVLVHNRFYDYIIPK